MVFSEANLRTARQREIVDTAGIILETEGPEALTMRRLAGELGIRAPSLYKHFPEKSAVETALIELGFRRWGEMARAALSQPGDPLSNLATTYRQAAREQPHLYRLMTEGMLDRSRLAPGLEDWSGAPLGTPFADPETARAFWAFLHGMVMLELDRRFPPDADIDRAWANGIRAFSAQTESTHG